MNKIFLALLILTVLIPGLTKAAEDPNPVETRLRETLRATMLQLRDAQTQVSTLQAAQAESDLAKKDLTEKLEAMTKEAKQEREAKEKITANAGVQLSNQEGEVLDLQESVMRHKDALAKWKFAYTQAVEIAKAKEAERARLEAVGIALQRKVEDRETKNLILFKTGNEILTRFEKFALGEALTAREPFIGTTRVKLEGLVQDYQDKLADQRAKPEQTSVEPTTASTPLPVEGATP
jgi:chromosome segregation ATPase